MCREARVADRADVGVASQTASKLVGRGGCALEAQLKCPHSANGEVGLQRAGNGFAKEASLAKAPCELIIPYDRCAQL
jgi:hypothetical protein